MMISTRQALASATADFATVSETPRLDAELLMAQAMGTTREDLLLRRLDDPAPPAFQALLARRLTHEPIAYITGTRAFWTIDLAVGPGALVPRADSETLIEAALEHFGATGPATILDLGTGPGTLLLAALDQWPGATGLGVDCSAEALTMAADNARRLGLADRAVVQAGDWFQPGDWVAAINRRFDLVLANPPYIGTGELLPPEVQAHEPAGALFAGADGLDAYRVIIPALPRLLEPGGIAVIEIGHTQADAVTALAGAVGLAARMAYDLGGRPRAIILS